MCAKRTHRVFRRTHRVSSKNSVRLSEFSSPKQYSRKRIPLVSYSPHQEPSRGKKRVVFSKRAGLASVPSFRSFVRSFCFLCPRSGLGPRNTGFCTLIPVLVPSFRFWGVQEHPPKPPVGKPPSCEPPKLGLSNLHAWAPCDSVT